MYDKRQPWDTDTHLPLLIRGPGIAPASVTAAPVSMPDLSATLLDMAGIARPPFFDGSSVLPFVSASPPAPRIATLVEYVGEGGGGGGARVCPLTSGDDTLMCNAAGNYSLPPYFYGHDFCLCQDSLNTSCVGGGAGCVGGAAGGLGCSSIAADSPPHYNLALRLPPESALPPPLTLAATRACESSRA